MKRSRKRSLFANPLLIWTDLALRTGEMLLASSRVIGHRTGRMAAAGAKPSARDRREFTLMGQEKIEAAAESAQAMAAHMVKMNPQLGARAVRQMLTGATAIMSLAASRNAGQSLARQAKLVRAMARSATTASLLSGSAARLAQRGLKPVHARATANAKRLGKR
jgi:methionine synthase I (cobalamin-dependent)